MILVNNPVCKYKFFRNFLPAFASHSSKRGLKPPHPSLKIKRITDEGVGLRARSFMDKEIAFLLQEHFLNYCKNMLGDTWQGHRITYFCYETLPELQQVFLAQKGHYDAFLVSGVIPLAALWEVDTPPYAVKDRIGHYLINTYRILLGLLFQRGSYDPARIGIDFVGEDVPLVQVLEEDRLPELVEEHNRHFLGMTVAELDEQERMLVADYQRRCRAGKLDVVITYYNSVVQGLAGEDVECYYSYPSRNSMIQALEQCVKQIRTETLRRNQSAVIRISPRYDLRARQLAANQGLELLSLKQALLEYCRQRQIDPVLKDDLSDVELYLTLEQLETITQQFTLCDLGPWLDQQVGFQGLVSLGSGPDLASARSHAMQAQDYRAHLEQDTCVYIDESEAIRSLPLTPRSSLPESGVSASQVEEAANRCHLSAETIYRVISAMQAERTDQLTSEELIRHQGFSLRVANRVLKALVTGGYAQIAGQRRVGNKGRPQNLYRISLEF